MILGGLQKLTLLDYPENVAATIFTYGCNFRCPFCHNASLVTSCVNDEVKISDFYNFLDSRANKLDGICITGGEPLINPEIFDFISGVKQKGFKVKLDTNGSFPNRLDYLIENKMVDYVAMDIKNSKEKYSRTCGLETVDITPVEKSVDILMKGTVSYEFRTTLVKELHTIEDIEKISIWLKGAKAYYLQHFVDSGNLIKPGFTAVSKEETERFADVAKQYIDCVGIRGIE